jgi:hypothetical protein
MSAVYIARATTVAARALDGEMMIMSAKDSTLFTLNPVATVIWQAADGQTPLVDIVEKKVCAEFDVAPAEALQDAEKFVGDLANHGVLLVSKEPIAAAKPVAGAKP